METIGRTRHFVDNSSLLRPAINRRVVTCHQTHARDLFNSEWKKTAAAFNKATLCELGQSWRKTIDPHLEPACARLVWSPQTLWVYAELTDVDIFNTARTLNDDTYHLGDVLEIFVHPLISKEYYELHVTPDNVHLQLRFERGRLLRPKEESVIHDPDFFRARTEVCPDRNRWRVLAQLPAQSIVGRSFQSGDKFHFSISRYDYTRGKKRPVLSSTSPHPRPNFHDCHSWAELVLSV